MEKTNIDIEAWFFLGFFAEGRTVIAKPLVLAGYIVVLVFGQVDAVQ